MPVDKIYYLTCSMCGNEYIDSEGLTIYGQTPEEVRDDATENGWICHSGVDSEGKDLCVECGEQL